MFIIREIQECDAEQFLALSKQLDSETKFMLLEPGERRTTLPQQQEKIRSILSQKNSTFLVAETNGQLIGYIAGLGGSYNRNRHKADVVIGILLDYVGKGLGSRLFSELELWARNCRVHKLELTVMAHNDRAINLYKKSGFVVEGISVDSLLVDGSYVDELDMAKFLGPSDRSSHQTGY